MIDRGSGKEMMKAEVLAVNKINDWRLRESRDHIVEKVADGKVILSVTFIAIRRFRGRS